MSINLLLPCFLAFCCVERAGWCYRSPFPSFPPPLFPAECGFPRPESAPFPFRSFRLAGPGSAAAIQSDRPREPGVLRLLFPSSSPSLPSFDPQPIHDFFLSPISPPLPPFLGVSSSSFFFFLIRLIIFFDLTTLLSLFSHLHRPFRRSVSRIPKPTLFCFDIFKFCRFSTLSCLPPDARRLLHYSRSPSWTRFLPSLRSQISNSLTTTRILDPVLLSSSSLATTLDLFTSRHNWTCSS